MPSQTGSIDLTAQVQAKNAAESAAKAYTDDSLAPIASKTYTGINISANSDPAGWLYFGSIKPDDYNTNWHIKYVLRSRITTITDSTQYSTVTIDGCKNTYYAYQTYNAVSNTTYRPIYSHVLYTLKEAGVTAGYGHLLGIRFQSAYWGSTFSATDWPREIIVDVIEAENCTVTLDNSMFLYANAPGTGITNYNARTAFDGTTQGFTQSGDRNETNHVLNNFSAKTGAKGIRAYSLFMEDGVGCFQGICTHTDGNINTNITVTSTKKANTNGFKVGSNIYYPLATVAANMNFQMNPYSSYGVLDTRYSFNTTLTAGSLTQYKALYLVGTVNSSDGLFYLDTTWWSQTPTTDGKVYVLVGYCYDSTTSNCRINLVETNTWYYCDNGTLKTWDEYQDELSAQTATNYITADANGIKIHMAGNSTTYQHQTSNSTTFYVSGKKRSQVAADGLHVYVDTTETEVAKFTADGAQIGKTSGSHILQDYHSMQMVDSNGTTYFHVSDLRGTDGLAEIVDTFKGDGSTKQFSLSFLADTSRYDMTVNVSDSSGGTITEYIDGISFESAPTYNATITVTYYTSSNSVKAYTLGKRLDDAIGAYSIAEGYNVTASGNYSYAEGIGTTASGNYSHAEGSSAKAIGDYSHAEGVNTQASGFCSHAEGSYTQATNMESHAEGRQSIASGSYSHAQNFYTRAGSSYQTAIGMYNANQSGNAFEIGNGSNSSARSNALTVDWSGNLIAQGMAGMVQMFAGSTAPTGWLMCDGSAVSRTTYATLFAVIGTTWGSGDGSTTFNLPDLRGRAPIGAGTGSGLTAHTLAAKTGAETHTLTAAQSGLPAHTHAFTQPTVKTELKFQKNAASGSAINRVAGSNLSNPAETSTYTATVTGGAVGAVTGGAQNASSAHNIMQPSVAINFIICTGKTS